MNRRKLIAWLYWINVFIWAVVLTAVCYPVTENWGVWLFLCVVLSIGHASLKMAALAELQRTEEPYV